MSSFVGSFRFSVDEKGRFSIPAPLRSGLALSAEGVFVVTPGPEGCLDAYPDDEWRRRLQMLRSVPGGTSGRYYRRLIAGQARQCKMDRQNRILVPPVLLRSVGITKTVLILGQLDHLELWDPTAYRDYIDAQQIPLEDVLEEIETQLRDNPTRRPGGDW